MPALKPLPWQAEAVAQLESAFRAGRLGQALLLIGPAGVGKRRFAEYVAAALLCEDSGRRAFAACGDCASCRLFAAGSHPDWSLLAPEEGKRDISIDAVRGLIEKLGFSAGRGGARIACLDPADALNANGCNALLKTIEEPPRGALIALLSTRPQSLPATLRSRCQRLRLPAPSRDVALAWLAAERPELAGELLAAALEYAYGAPLTALELVDSGLIERYRTWDSALTRLSAGNSSPLEAAAAIGATQPKTFEHLQFMKWLHGRLLVAVKREAGAAEVPALGVRLPRLIDAASETAFALSRSASVQLSIEALLIEWQRVFASGARVA